MPTEPNGGKSGNGDADHAAFFNILELVRVCGGDLCQQTSGPGQRNQQFFIIITRYVSMKQKIP